MIPKSCIYYQYVPGYEILWQHMYNETCALLCENTRNYEVNEKKHYLSFHNIKVTTQWSPIGMTFQTLCRLLPHIQIACSLCICLIDYRQHEIGSCMRSKIKEVSSPIWYCPKVHFLDRQHDVLEGLNSVILLAGPLTRSFSPPLFS